MTFIESESNPRYKRWKKLATESRAVKKEGATLLEGAHLCETALANRSTRVAALLVNESPNAEAQALVARAQAQGMALFTLKNSLFQALSPVEHGIGIMMEIAVPVLTIDSLDAMQSLLYLDGVQDTGNAGTLIRTAVAAGVKTIVTSPSTVQLWTPKVLRAGMGAHFGATLIEGVSAHQLRERFSGTILAADARGGEDLFATDNYPQAPTAWIMGAEGPGVSEEALSLTDRRFYIPIEPDCESLNVAAAAAVCLFEQRRRWRK